MQLSVACNLILKGVRKLTGRWIISHRRSRMAVYVLWCNAQNKSHSNLLTCIRPYSVNCPSVICLPSMLYILSRDASSELWTPVLFFTLLNQPQSSSVYFLQFYFTANISFHSIQLILCFQQTGEIDNLTVSWGKVFWLCCGRFHVVADAGSAPCQ